MEERKREILYLMSCRRDHVEIHNTISNEFRKNHLWLNSGGAAALVIFFSPKQNVPGCVKLACIFFIVGTILSALAYIWEFRFFYKNLKNFDRKFFPYSHDSDETLENKRKEYEKYQEENKCSSECSILLRAIYGIVCYFFFICGIISVSLILFSSSLVTPKQENKIITNNFMTLRKELENHSNLLEQQKIDLESISKDVKQFKEQINLHEKTVNTQ